MKKIRRKHCNCAQKFNATIKKTLVLESEWVSFKFLCLTMKQTSCVVQMNAYIIGYITPGSPTTFTFIQITAIQRVRLIALRSKGLV